MEHISTHAKAGKVLFAAKDHSFIGDSTDVKLCRQILREMYFEANDAIDDNQMKEFFKLCYDDIDELLFRLEILKASNIEE